MTKNDPTPTRTRRTAAERAEETLLRAERRHDRALAALAAHDAQIDALTRERHAAAAALKHAALHPALQTDDGPHYDA